MTENLISRLLRNRGPEGMRLHGRLIDFQARRFVPDPGDSERLVACPSVGCGQVLVDAELVERRGQVVCPTCALAFCTSCCQPAHPGNTCDAAELDRMEPELRRLLERETWRRCPSCRSVCERVSGCNFITCPSEKCQGKTNFCYLCGVLLTAEEHASHFEGFEGALGRVGPFGSVCKNHREVNYTLPTWPPPPKLSVVSDDQDEVHGKIALRIVVGPLPCEPAIIYYKVRVYVIGSEEVISFGAGFSDPPYHDLKKIPKYRKYQASVVPVNANGKGPESELSDIVYFHEREIAAPETTAQTAPKSKRWVTR